MVMPPPDRKSSDSILYGADPESRSAAPAEHERTLSDGTIEYYDAEGHLYQIWLLAGNQHPLLPETMSILYRQVDATISLENGKVHGSHDDPAVITVDGWKEWWCHGVQHRDHGPALLAADGEYTYYHHGLIHREDGPAMGSPDGGEEYRKEGLRHRDDGPALIFADGTQEWWRQGRRHRDDGPAVIDSDGTEEWYQDGSLHRDGGPAVIDSDGTEEWWLHGCRRKRKRHHLRKLATLRQMRRSA